MHSSIRVVILIGILAILYGSLAAPSPDGISDIINGAGDGIKNLKDGIQRVCGAMMCPSETPFYSYSCCGLNCCLNLTPLSIILIAVVAGLIVICACVCLCCSCCCHLNN